MSEPFHIMTKPQLKAVIQRMENTEVEATRAGNHDLAYKIQLKLVELAFMLHPEWDRRPAVKAAAPKPPPPKRNGVAHEEPSPTPEEREDVRALSDEELERSLGR